MTDQLEAGGVEVAPEALDHADAGTVDGSAPAPGARPSKWDRPPDPHDWRYVVGTIGKILIATGLLLFGFVAYQLWGTGIETARAQNQLEDEFERIVAEARADRPAAPDDDPTDPGPEPSADADGGATIPDGDEVEPGSGDETTSDDDLADAAASITTIPPAIDLSDEAVEQDIPAIRRGEVLARLEIPRIGEDVYVVPGVRLEDLKDGPGHYPDTPLPGQLGNASIAGHRTTYGAPFFDVDQLQPGDELIVTMITGDQFVYLVTGVEIVAATDYWVVSTQNPDIAELTLTSCHPKYTARDRIVVHSVLDPSRSSNVGVPTFYDLGEDEPAEPIPGDDPVVTRPAADEAGDLDTDDPGAGSQSDAGPATAVVDDPPPATGDDDPAVDEDTDVVQGGSVDGSTDPDRPLPGREVDAFAHGWFDDPGAFWQIALWGMVLTVLSLLAHRVSRRFRRDSIGALVGIVPFLVALYFFFQNVNRLLPPGL